LIGQAFRPDRVIAAATQLVASVLGPQFLSRAETELELASLTDAQLNATTPALLCSVPGYDASGNEPDLSWLPFNSSSSYPYPTTWGRYNIFFIML
jgi:hypothetical protein